MTAEPRWLVVGAGGMLGTEVLGRLSGRRADGIDLPDIDITDPESVEDALRGTDVVVNCAAYTAVDEAETNEATAFQVNAEGPANLARACSRHGATLIQISTDYVFDGSAASAYQVGDVTGPLSAYGRTKLAGEWAVRSLLPDSSLVLRTAWLYGANGPNFLKTMASLEQQRETISVVDDQRGQPTWAADLAQRVIEAVDAQVPAGTYHATNTGATTWFGFARRIFELLGADPDRVQPTATSAFPRPASRPANSTLAPDCWTGTGLDPMRPWREALDAAWPGVLG